ncbi:DUF4249 domain-containing protein [Salinimicrobium xinjiangense]|uniref:DUF4249 domain-containing protein n=1 Tax=Salinimicrobium xinjiangense TaxID=438596 RepID=UPI00040ABEA8|nr:DUF4249 domain-containing protein [Salinimicrobium xinjiangense]
MIKLFFGIVLVSGFHGCVEPIEIESQTFEDALVIEGIITNELQRQEILLSRTFRLEERGPAKESNAQVWVLSEGQSFSFSEAEPGRYVSDNAFRAVPGRSYTLEVNTSNGRKYSSEPEQLTEAPGISNVYAKKTSFRNEEGIAILLDVKGAEGNYGFYLYDFSETYKIVSPLTTTRDLIYMDGEFIEVPKTKEESVCYVTEPSQEVLLANTYEQSGSDLNRFLVRFIENKDYKTAYRYSILVKQYSISADAFSFYETLRDFSDSESLFSQNQLGLINGNLFSESDPNEKVIGFFSIADVSSQRIFFDFEDFYERSEVRPASHVTGCEISVPDLSTTGNKEALAQQLNVGNVKYFAYEFGVGYKFVKAGCIDCTVFGTNVVPDFWEK